MFNPIWLKTFATVAGSSSFTEAGRRLGLTQSSVSDHIRRLEERTARRLFVRDTHSLALTADGESLLVHAHLILQAHERAEAQFNAPRLRGRVRFGTSDDLAMGPLPDMLAVFRNKHPEVELEITIGLTSELYQRLDNDELDLIVGKRRPGEQRGQSMLRVPLVWLARPESAITVDLAAGAQRYPCRHPRHTGREWASLAHRVYQWQSCRLHGRRARRVGVDGIAADASFARAELAAQSRQFAAVPGCGICGLDGQAFESACRYLVSDFAGQRVTRQIVQFRVQAFIAWSFEWAYLPKAMRPPCNWAVPPPS